MDENFEGHGGGSWSLECLRAYTLFAEVKGLKTWRTNLQLVFEFVVMRKTYTFWAWKPTPTFNLPKFLRLCSQICLFVKKEPQSKFIISSFMDFYTLKSIWLGYHQNSFAFPRSLNLLYIFLVFILFLKLETHARTQLSHQLIPKKKNDVTNFHNSKTIISE